MGHQPLSRRQVVAGSMLGRQPPGAHNQQGGGGPRTNLRGGCRDGVNNLNPNAPGSMLGRRDGRNQNFGGPYRSSGQYGHGKMDPSPCLITNS